MKTSSDQVLGKGAGPLAESAPVSEDALSIWVGVGAVLGAALVLFVLPYVNLPRTIYFALWIGLMTVVARWKGFSPWAWMFAAGVLGLIVLLFLPSAKAPGLDAAVCEARRTKATRIGTIITAIGFLVGIVLATVLLLIING